MSLIPIFPGARKQGRIGDFIAADVACPDAVWTEVGKITVPAGVGYSLGFGYAGGQDSAAGRIYGDLIDTAAAAMVGEIKIELRDAYGEVRETLFEGGIEQLKTSATDRTQQIPFPWKDTIATQDQDIVIKVRQTAGAAKTLDVSASTLTMDMTKFRVELR